MNSIHLNRYETPIYVAGVGYQWTPSLAAGVSVTAGTSSAFGSWAEIISAVVEDTLILGIQPGFSTAPGADLTWIEYEIGLGPSGSEFPVWQHKHYSIDIISSAGASFLRAAWFPRALFIRAGQRVSVRSAASTNSFATLISLGWVYNKDVNGSSSGSDGGSTGGK